MNGNSSQEAEIKDFIKKRKKKRIKKTNKQTHPKKTQIEKSNKNKKDEWNPVPGWVLQEQEL